MYTFVIVFIFQVYLAHRRPLLPTPLPSNVYQMKGVKRVLEDGVVLDDDTELKLDALILCTGYKYEFPFLSEECQISTEGERVTPLYKHVTFY